MFLLENHGKYNVTLDVLIKDRRRQKNSFGWGFFIRWNEKKKKKLTIDKVFYICIYIQKSSSEM